MKRFCKVYHKNDQKCHTICVMNIIRGSFLPPKSKDKAGFHPFLRILTFLYSNLHFIERFFACLNYSFDFLMIFYVLVFDPVVAVIGYYRVSEICFSLITCQFMCTIELWIEIQSIFDTLLLFFLL